MDHAYVDPPSIFMPEFKISDIKAFWASLKNIRFTLNKSKQFCDEF
jgi:hypothetical protein